MVGKQTQSVQRGIHIFYIVSALIVLAFVAGMGVVYRFNTTVQEKFQSIHAIFMPVNNALVVVRRSLVELQNHFQDAATLAADSPSDEFANQYLLIKGKLSEIEVLLDSHFDSRDLSPLFTKYYVDAFVLAVEMHANSENVLVDDIQKVVMVRGYLEERLGAIENFLATTYSRDVLDARQKMDQLTWTIFGLIFLLTSTLAAVSTMIIRGLSNRVGRLVAFAKEVEAGNYAISINMPWHDEFETVAKALDSMVRSINEKNAVLTRLANFDPLTEIHNRNSLIDRVNAEIRAVRRHKYPMSFCLCDVDHFKQVNDNHGHLAGDQVLRSFAQTIKDELRLEDVIGRYGGDEFCIMLPHTPASEAEKALNRVLRKFVSLEFIDDDKKTFTVTASFGVCQYRPEMEATDLIRAADEALYRAKNNGRNQVFVDTGNS